MPRPIEEHTRDKLLTLIRYLPAYLRATQRARELVYIDAFAGPGRNQLKSTAELIDGSPLIALRARSKEGSVFSRFFFVEQDGNLASELESVLNEQADARPIKVIHGDANAELPKIIQGINRRSPTFVFLDPEGVDPSWQTIESIAPWRTELLINVPLGMSINRNWDSDKVVHYFGSSEAVRIWQSGSSTWRRDLLDFYKRRLYDLGYRYPTGDDVLVKRQSGQHLYYLVHVSKVEPAHRIMQWVQKQPTAAGQMRLNL